MSNNEKRAPVQGYPGGIPWAIHLEAYEVYCKRWGAQPALIDLEGRNCRGGFSTGELDEFIPGWRDRVSEFGQLKTEVLQLRAEVTRLRELVNTPQLHDFSTAVVLEAAHQRERWGSEHDAGKAPEDWFWLLGYLGGKALAAAKSGNTAKALHHTVSSAAALANWHAALSGSDTAMRPGIDPAAHGMPTA